MNNVRNIRFSPEHLDFFAQLGLTGAQGRPSSPEASEITIAALTRRCIDRFRLVVDETPIDLPEGEVDAFLATGRRLPFTPDDIRTFEVLFLALKNYPSARGLEVQLEALAARAANWTLAQRVAAATRIEIRAASRNPE